MLTLDQTNTHWRPSSNFGGDYLYIDCQRVPVYHTHWGVWIVISLVPLALFSWQTSRLGFFVSGWSPLPPSQAQAWVSVSVVFLGPRRLARRNPGNPIFQVPWPLSKRVLGSHFGITDFGGWIESEVHGGYDVGFDPWPHSFQPSWFLVVF